MFNGSTRWRSSNLPRRKPARDIKSWPRFLSQRLAEDLTTNEWANPCKAGLLSLALPRWTPPRRAQFAMTDVLRRAQGDALGTFGLGPKECPYRIIAFGAHWRLRDYANHDASSSLLIVAAPIKRPYIWDLVPSVSAVRYCLRRGFHVYLLEWAPASRGNRNNGLDEYAEAVFECVAKVSGEAPGTNTKPFLMGHSLGGTLAAIFSALAPESVQGLILLGAPLCFEPATSHFRDALVSLVPPALSEADPFPGSLVW